MAAIDQRYGQTDRRTDILRWLCTTCTAR